MDNILEPLPYHLELRDYLKSEERELWNWFASARALADYTEGLRIHLLKCTYRLEAESHPELFRAVDAVRSGLGLDIPITLYQAQNAPQPNAAVCFIPGEAHVVLSGPILGLLTGDELKSILGHELAHYQLWQWEGGELHIADRLLQAVANDPRAAASHEQTARHFRLYAELHADRGSLRVTGDLAPVIAGLVKTETGLAQVSASAYLKQAEEIFAKEAFTTEGLSHPEAIIRARALSLWADRGPEAHPELVRMIEGPERLDNLDLMGQRRVMARTRLLLEQFLRPKWFQTPSVLGHAKLFFENCSPSTGANQALLEACKSDDPRTREFYCYLLLDFVTADPELEELPLAAALELSRQLDLDPQFEKLAAKELKLKVREVRKLKDRAAELLAQAEAAA